jgi:hypothetical protein
MGTLNATLTLSYGDTTPTGSVPRRIPLSFDLTYVEWYGGIILVPASSTDQAITFGTVGAPKLLFARSLNADVSVKLSDGVVATPAPTTLTSTGGWVLLSSQTGQAINRLLVTTGSTPVGGAQIEVLAFE